MATSRYQKQSPKASLGSHKALLLCGQQSPPSIRKGRRGGAADPGAVAQSPGHSTNPGPPANDPPPSMRLRSDFIGLGHVGGRPPGPQTREPLSAWEPTEGVALQRDRCQPSTTVRGASASPVLRGKGRADTSGCWLASLGKHSRRAAQDLRSTPHAAVADDPLTRRQRRARGADVVLEGPPHRRRCACMQHDDCARVHSSYIT